MTIKRALELMQIEKECVSRGDTCSRDCGNCELVQDTDELLEAYKTIDDNFGNYITNIPNAIVQFTENHKWCGCLGIVTEIKDCGDDRRFMIGVPIPERGTAYIFSMESENEFEWCGTAVLIPE